MNEFFDHPLSIVAATGFVTIGVALFLGFLRYAQRVVKTLDHLDERVLPHFTPPPAGQPDLSLPARMEHVFDELSANHGTSVRDRVKRMDEGFSDHERRLTFIEDHVFKGRVFDGEVDG